MSTTPPVNTPNPELWTTTSKKKLSFGFIIVVASIGIGPLLQTLSLPGFILQVAFILTGVWIAYDGYREK